MTPAEIAAYIGAAAWLPLIVTWIYRAYVTPKVRLVASPNVEIGYTVFGPIFNLGCALSASRKDAVIQNIKITVQHERGQSSVLTWKTLNETFSQIRSATGETAEVSKSQPAIALKVSTISLVEKVIGFQDLEFQDRGRILVNSVVEHMNFLKKSEPDYADKTIKSKPSADLVDFYKRNVFWQEGRYTAMVRIELAETRKPTLQKLEFVLSPNDADRLSQNVSENERYVTDTIKTPETAHKIQYLWNWTSPSLRMV